MRLDEALKNIDRYPFHMPGHKRNPDFGIDGADIDITEIDGFDNLHSAEGMIAQLEEELSNIFKSKKSYLSVNGSTCGVLSAVHAVCSRGDTVLVARNCHQSVYNACCLLQLHVEYIVPEFDERYGIYREITQKEVDAALKKHPDASAVIITSPTYEGVVSNISAKVPVIVDSAHGAHFGMADWLPDRAAGDIVITSLHKTLPCLTQTAAVNVYNDKYIDAVKKYMDIFETSSPSYILMNSASKMVEIIRDKSLFDALYNNLNRLYSTKFDNLEFIPADDKTKINVSTVKCSLCGNEVADLLRSMNIEPEMSDEVHVILMATVGDTDKGFDILINALKQIDKKCRPGKRKISPISLPEKVCEMWQVEAAEKTDFESSKGLVAAESVFAYPPGIPILVPGEKISADIVNYVKNAVEQGTNIVSAGRLLPAKILTKTV